MGKHNIREKKADLIADYRAVFNTEAGERVLYDLMKKCHMLHTSYNGNVNDCIFMEGERNVVNYIRTTLKQDPVKIREIIRKQEEEELDYV